MMYFEVMHTHQQTCGIGTELLFSQQLKRYGLSETLVYYGLQKKQKTERRSKTFPPWSSLQYLHRIKRRYKAMKSFLLACANAKYILRSHRPYFKSMLRHLVKRML